MLEAATKPARGPYCGAKRARVMAATCANRPMIKRAFCHLKDWRRRTNIYDKLDINCASAIAIAAISLWWA